MWALSIEVMNKMDIKQEDLIKFWTWCGFTQYPQGRKNFHYDMGVKVMDWIAPRHHYGNMGYLPRLGLSEIYEYAIPKLQDKGYSVVLTAYEHKGFEAMISDIIHDEVIVAREESDNPTDALYKAIMAVIDKG